MSEKQQPWGKWFWGDWRKDARLRRCTFAARGLWADMLSLMGGECDRFGFLVMGGAPLDHGDLAGLLGGAPREIQKLLSELAQKGVFNRIGDQNLPPDVVALLPDDLPEGVVFSRRMIRDKAKAERDRQNGGRGGNPALKGPHGKEAESENGVVNPQDKAQKPEARSQKLENQDSALAGGAGRLFGEGDVPEAKAHADGFEQFWAAFDVKKNCRNAKKPDALKAWDATEKSRPLLPVLLQALANYLSWVAEKSRKEKRDYPVQHPSTWLRGEVWVNYLPVAAPEPSPVHPSWGSRADELAGLIGQAEFNTYFADAEILEDGEPPALRLGSIMKRNQAERKFARQLRTIFRGEFRLEARAA